MSHVPNRGEIVSVNLNPKAGREIDKIRPVLVMTPTNFNRMTGMAVVCPITTKPKDGPFEVRVAGKKVVGAVLPDLVRSLDWRARQATLIEKVDPVILAEVTAKLAAIIGVP